MVREKAVGSPFGFVCPHEAVRSSSSTAMLLTGAAAAVDNHLRQQHHQRPHFTNCTQKAHQLAGDPPLGASPSLQPARPPASDRHLQHANTTASSPAGTTASQHAASQRALLASFGLLGVV
jgi:hypothetical protein